MKIQITFLSQLILFILPRCSAYNYTICTSFRIRGHASDLKRMAHCDVIVGNLIIDMINNNTSPEDWKTYGNLRLQEITEFLLLHDVDNLLSLDILFPNLNVIRGNKLLHNKYALGIFQAKKLETLNLQNLTAIVNGGIFVAGNARLNGYIHRVDWSRITQSEKALNYIGDIMGDIKICNDSCENGNCWSRDSCQKQCPRRCQKQGCSANGECCHELCIGGCSEPNDLSKCYSCRKFRDPFMQGCKDQCQDQQYEWEDFKCIVAGDCIKSGRKLHPDKNRCVTKCPGRYVEDSFYVCTLHSKNCTGGFIGSEKDSEKFSGCENVDGPLWIRLPSQNNVTILETNLGGIRRISGFLNIFETDAKSLTFLRNLSVIEGSQLSDNKYALVVKDCKNLESLWPSKTNLIIKKGLAFFYLNPKLCPQTITDSVRSESLSSSESSLTSLFNGYRVSCKFEEIDVKATAPFEKGVIKLQFKKPPSSHLRQLIGYWIYYIKKPDKIFFRGKEDIDSQWSLKFVPYEDDSTTIFKTRLENLEPANTYAIFVISRMAKSKVTYQSRNITYARTKQFYPGRPRSLQEVYARNTITLTWSSPSRTFGAIDFYKIKLTPIHISPQENICSEGNLAELRHTELTEITNANILESSSAETPTLTSPQVEDVIDSITNIILFRSVPEMTPVPVQAQKLANSKGLAKRYTPFFSRFPRSISDDMNQTEFVVSEPTYVIERLSGSPADDILYNVEIRACHNISTECKNQHKQSCNLCSETPLKKELCLLFTDIDTRPRNVKVSKINSTHVIVKWEEPKINKGLIQSYSVSFKRQKTGHPSSLEQKFCVNPNTTQMISNGFSFAGNYEVYVETILYCWNSSHIQKMSHPESFNITTSNLWTSILLHMSWLSLFCLIIFIIYRASAMWIPSKFDKIDAGLTVGTNTNYGVSGRSWWQDQFNSMIGDQWNHKDRNLTLGNKLGEGHFAKVFEGSLRTKGGVFMVAAKVLKKLDQLDKDIINEASLMLEARSFHLVRSYGMVLKNYQLYLIMEFMTNGNLETFLKQRHRGAFRNTQYGTPEQLLNFALQVADGMYYLQTKKIIHRDLAARNCLLDQSYNVKISDFGLSRFTRGGGYEMKNSRLLELARMPPEIFYNKLFTHKSDVWLFGILLWELATECSCRPHEGLREDQLRVVILGGKTLVESFPHSTPFYIIPLAISCWKRSPSQRPSFLQILTKLLLIAKDYSFYSDFQTNSCYFMGELMDDNTDFHAVTSDEEESDSGTPLSVQ